MRQMQITKVPRRGDRRDDETPELRSPAPVDTTRAAELIEAIDRLLGAL